MQIFVYCVNDQDAEEIMYVMYNSMAPPTQPSRLIISCPYTFPPILSSIFYMGFGHAISKISPLL